jgi:AmmeMemoRadiSam system protein A
MNLSIKDKHQLLSIARRGISTHLHQTAMTFSDDERGNERLQLTTGVFVTLTVNSALRGCIGALSSEFPLIDETLRQARNAAFHDPRFDALTPDELELITIGISVLTPSISVGNYADIQIGEHGIILRKAGRSAVFLPKVAAEQGWTLEETLSHLSRKAGLVENAWKSDCEFLVFKSIDFEE